jgi:arabinofuranosyltransferase
VNAAFLRGEPCALLIRTGGNTEQRTALQTEFGPYRVTIINERYALLYDPPEKVIAPMFERTERMGHRRLKQQAKLEKRHGTTSRANEVLHAASIVAVAAAVTAVVFLKAWVCEDAFITFRYVANVLAGYGAAFNRGEYVQGYTHPLWFLLLCVGTMVAREPIYVAIGLGLLFTILTVVQLGHALRRLGSGRSRAIVATGIASAVLVSSESWLSFQTGGLENALAHLLIVALLVRTIRDDATRPGQAVLLAGLLVLTRPDFALLVAPLVLLLSWRTRNRPALLRLTSATLPVLIWVAAAWVYYGDPVPNTAYAKVGIYPTLGAAIEQGSVYFADWVAHEPFPAAAALLLYAVGLVLAKRPEERAWAAGILVYTTYVIGVGGDFMRGRMLLPIFVASTGFGTLAWAKYADDRWSSPRVVLLICSVFGVALFAGEKVKAPPRTGIPPSGIVDERRFYPGYHLNAYWVRGRLVNPYINLGFVEQLRRYAAECGPVTIHLGNPGTVGYLSGAQVSIIDTLGLTDSFIAKLPRANLIHLHPRPGHPDKFIPLWYLASKRDIAVIQGWEDAVAREDCSFRGTTERYKNSTRLYDPSTELP